MKSAFLLKIFFIFLIPFNSFANNSEDLILLKGPDFKIPKEDQINNDLKEKSDSSKEYDNSTNKNSLISNDSKDSIDVKKEIIAFKTGSYVDLKLLTNFEFYENEFNFNDLLILGELSTNDKTKQCRVFLKPKEISFSLKKGNFLGSKIVCSYGKKTFESKLNGYVIDSNKNIGVDLILNKIVSNKDKFIASINLRNKYIFIFTENVEFIDNQ